MSHRGKTCCCAGCACPGFPDYNIPPGGGVPHIKTVISGLTVEAETTSLLFGFSKTVFLEHSLDFSIWNGTYYHELPTLPNGCLDYTFGSIPLSTKTVINSGNSKRYNGACTVEATGTLADMTLTLSVNGKTITGLNGYDVSLQFITTSPNRPNIFAGQRLICNSNFVPADESVVFALPRPNDPTTPTINIELKDGDIWSRWPRSSSIAGSTEAGYTECGRTVTIDDTTVQSIGSMISEIVWL